jgi:hypothetical protein
VAEHEAAASQLIVLSLGRADAVDLLELKSDGVKPVAPRRLLIAQAIELVGRLTPVCESSFRLLDQVLVRAEIVNQPALHFTISQPVLLVLTVNCQEMRSDPLQSPGSDRHIVEP